MGAHYSINIVAIQPQFVQKSSCKSTLTIIVVDDELHKPANIPTINSPPASESVASKVTVDGNPNIYGYTAREIIASEFLLA